MKCPKCGFENEEHLTSCPRCDDSLTSPKKPPWRFLGCGCLGWTVFTIIVLLLVAMMVPSYYMSPNMAKYTDCIQSLGGLKVAEEMYISDHGVYTDVHDKLAMYIIQGCTDPTGAAAGCGDVLTTRMKKYCDNVVLHSLAKGYDYEITGIAKDKYKANICVNPKGFSPVSYRDVTSTGPPMNCPQ